MRLNCMYIQGSTTVTDNEGQGAHTIYSQTSMIHMYCTMLSTSLVLQGRRQLNLKT